MMAMTRKVAGMRQRHLVRLLDVGERHDRLAGEVEVDRLVAELVAQRQHAVGDVDAGVAVPEVDHQHGAALVRA